MATHADILGVLKDKSRSWTDRIKVARYAWKYDVGIPNKEQLILDWLCQAITSKNRLRHEESLPVWQCLHDVLHNNKVEGIPGKCYKLVFKASLFQILIEELEHASQEKTGSCEDIELIVSCCNRLVTSSVASTYTCKYDLMLQLLEAELKLCVTKINHHVDVEVDLLNLLEVTLDKFVTSHIQRPNNQQMCVHLCNKLLLPALMLHGAQTHSQQLQSITQHLLDFILKTFFAKELQSHYELYLRLNTGQLSSSAVPPKFIDSIFNKFTEFLQSQNYEARKCAISYLPVLYNAFVSSPCAYNKKDAWFLMMIHIGHILGVSVPLNASESKTNDVTASFTESKDVEEKLSALSLMLHTVLDSDVYSVATDNENSNIHLAWFHRLLSWLRNYHIRCTGWNDSVENLLKLNHLIVEKQLPAIFCCCIIKDSENQTEGNDAGTLLVSVVDVYEKLRQVPKLFNCLIQAIKMIDTSDLSCHVSWPQQFWNRLGECVCGLAAATVLDIWAGLTTQVSSAIQSDEQQEYNGSRLGLLSELSSLLMSNMRLVDGQVPKQVVGKIHTLMHDTYDKALKPGLQASVDKSEERMCYWLNMLHTWISLRMLLSWYGKDADTLLESDTVNGDFTDLSSLFADTTAEFWSKIWKITTKSADYRLKHIMNMLLVQKVHAYTAYRQNDGTAVSKMAQSVVDSILSPLTVTDTLTSSTWNGQVLSITDKNYRVSQWQLLCNNFHIMYDYCTKQQLQTVAQVALNSFNQQQCFSDSQRCVKMQDITRQLLHEYHELAGLQYQVINVMWTNVANILAVQLDAKKKHETVWCKIIEGFGQLSDAGTENRVEASTKLEQMKTVCYECCAQVLTLQHKQRSKLAGLLNEEQIQSLVSWLQVLKSLPFFPGSMLPVCLVQCCLGLQLMLVVCSISSSKELSGLLKECLHGLVWLLSNLKDIDGLKLFVDSQADELLQWFYVVTKQYVESQKMSNESQEFVSNAFYWLAGHVDWSTSAAGLVQMVTEDLSKYNGATELQQSDVSLYVCAEILGKLSGKPNLKSAETDEGPAAKKPRNSLSSQDGDLAGKLRKVFLKKLKQTLCCDEPLMQKRTVNQWLMGYSHILKELSRSSAESLLQEAVQFVPRMCEECQKAIGNSNDLTMQISGIKFLRIVLERETMRKYVPSDTLTSLWKNVYELTNSTIRVKHANIPTNDKQSAAEQKNTVQGSLWLPSGILQDLLHFSDKEDVMDVDDDDDASAARDPDSESDTKEQLQLVKLCLTLLMKGADDEFMKDTILKTLQNDIDGGKVRSSVEQVGAAIYMYDILLSVVSQQHYTVMASASQQVMLKLQGVIFQCKDMKEDMMVEVLLAPALQLIKNMISHGTSLLGCQDISVCLGACVMVDLDRVSDHHYDTVFCLVCGIANVLLIKFASSPKTTPMGIINRCIPPFLQVVNRLLCSIIQRGKQEAAGQNNPHLLRSAQSLDRLLKLIRDYKEDFHKVAPYIIAHYVNEIQKVTVLPQIKVLLEAGMFEILEICDSFGVAQLHTVLAPGVREIFKTLYDDYNHHYVKHVYADLQRNY